MSIMENEEIKNKTRSVWGATPAGSMLGAGQKLGTKEYFKQVVEKRFANECDWMFEVVDFKSYKDKRVLEIGCGCGYDAYQFCVHGARYTGIDLVPQNPILARNNLKYFGCSVETYEMDVEQLRLPANHYDFVFSFGVLHHVPDIDLALRNIYRVVRPGGGVQVIVYHKISIFYLLHIAFFDWILRGKFRTISLAKRLSMIEFTESGQLPLVTVYSKRELQKKIKDAGFIIEDVKIRKLKAEDLPNIKFIARFYKYIPGWVLSWMSRRWGWYLSVKAQKPSN